MSAYVMSFLRSKGKGTKIFVVYYLNETKIISKKKRKTKTIKEKANKMNWTELSA